MSPQHRAPAPGGWYRFRIASPLVKLRPLILVLAVWGSLGSGDPVTKENPFCAMLRQNPTRLLEELDSVLRNEELSIDSENPSDCEKTFSFEFEKAGFLRPRLKAALAVEEHVVKTPIATETPTFAEMESVIVIELLPTTHLSPNRENSFIIGNPEEAPPKTDVTHLWNELLTEIRKKASQYSATSTHR